MQKRELEKGDLVQIKPGHQFEGQFVMVTNPKEFGCQGMLFLDQEIEGLYRYNGIAYVRVAFEDIEYVGKAEFVRVYKEEN